MSARTAQESSPTKQRLLDAAQELMLAKGFAATSVEEICEAAKLTKGCFFHYFESKDELGRELIARFCASSQRMHQAMMGDDPDPLKRVYHYIDEMIKCCRDPAMAKGCLLGQFSQELCGTNPRIRRSCCDGFSAWTAQVADALGAAKAKHAPRSSIQPQSLAEHLIVIVEGSLILGKAKQDRAVSARNLRHFKAYVQGLFGE